MYVLEGYHENIQLFHLSTPLLFNSLPEEVLKKRARDLEWLCGFSEAESMFFISTTGALSFRIKLHWDDKGSLVYINNLLGELVGRNVGFCVNVYDYDKLVKGSPFCSYTQAALAMGNINISSVISKKNRYRKVVQTEIYIWIFCLIWY